MVRSQEDGGCTVHGRTSPYWVVHRVPVGAKRGTQPATVGTLMAAPFTEEQVTYLEEREERLGEHGTAWSRSHLRSYSRRALSGFVILLLGLMGAFYAGGQDARTSRDAIVHSGRYVSVE